MLLWLMVSIVVSLFMSFISILLAEDCYIENINLFIVIQTFVIFCIFGVFFYYSNIDKENHKLIEHQQELVWKANRCPVYKSSCGSAKYPYACEKKATVVGRNQVGDIFVDAYPIC